MILADFFKKKPSSGNVAKDRLKLVLVSDRANCSPDIMEQIKNDIISVLSKYLEIDLEGLDIKISQTDVDGDGSVPALFANIPIKDMKSEARKNDKKNTSKSDAKSNEKKDNSDTKKDVNKDISKETKSDCNNRKQNDAKCKTDISKNSKKNSK